MLTPRHRLTLNKNSSVSNLSISTILKMIGATHKNVIMMKSISEDFPTETKE